MSEELGEAMGEELSIEDQLSQDYDAAIESDEAPVEAAEAPLEVAEGDVPESAEESPGEAPIEPYAHWTEEEKAIFANQPREVQQVMIDRQKDMDRRYTEKTTEIADFRKSWEPVNEIFAPYMADLQASGTNPAQLINEWAGTYMSLLQDPAGTIHALAAQYGVDLGATEEGEDGYVDPQIYSLQQQLQQLQGSLSERDQRDYATQVTAAQAEIDRFKEATTDTGEPAHPFFDEVFDQMVKLAKAETAEGRTPELNQLYEDAVYLNPTVRAKVLAAQQEATAKKAKEAAREKAEKARLAGFNVGGGPGGAVPTEDMSIEDSIRQMM